MGHTSTVIMWFSGLWSILLILPVQSAGFPLQREPSENHGCSEPNIERKGGLRQTWSSHGRNLFRPLCCGGHLGCLAVIQYLPDWCGLTKWQVPSNYSRRQTIMLQKDFSKSNQRTIAWQLRVTTQSFVALEQACQWACTKSNAT